MTRGDGLRAVMLTGQSIFNGQRDYQKPKWGVPEFAVISPILGALFENDCTGAAIIDRQCRRQKIFEIGYGRLFVLANICLRFPRAVHDTFICTFFSHLLYILQHLFEKKSNYFSLISLKGSTANYLRIQRCHAAVAKPAPSIERGVCAFPRLVIYRFDQRINGFYFANGVLCLSTIPQRLFWRAFVILADAAAPAFCANEFGFISSLIFYIYYTRFFTKSQTFFCYFHEMDKARGGILLGSGLTEVRLLPRIFSMQTAFSHSFPLRQSQPHPRRWLSGLRLRDIFYVIFLHLSLRRRNGSACPALPFGQCGLSSLGWCESQQAPDP